MRVFIFIALCVFLAQSTEAQNRNERRNKRIDHSLNIHAQSEIPVGEFAEFTDDIILGLGGSFISRTGVPFIKSGVHFSYGQLGNYKDQVNIYQGENVYGAEVFEEANVLVRHKSYRGMGSIRFQPLKKKFQPYVEGLAGLTAFSSSAKYIEGSGRERNTISSDNLERSLTTTYGWSAGAKFQMERNFFLEITYQHLTGGRASYINPDSFFLNEKEIFEYNIQESKTSSSVIQIGFSLDF